jgi:predicted ATPase
VEERSRAARLRHARELRAPLVGRDVEVALLWRSLENVVTGQGAIVSVIGEAGIGKSRLVQEVRARAQEEGLGLTWLEGHPLEHGEPVPYGCFRTLLREAVGVKGQVDVPPDGERLLLFLQDLMPGQAEEVYPYLGRLLGVPLSPEMEERLEHLDGESLKWQTLQVLRDCISALASRSPLLLVFEDLHWVDPASAELLERLLPLAGRMALTIVGVYRPEPERPSWRLREVAGRKYGEVYNELWLHPLSPTAAREMVAHLLGTDPSLEETVDLILERAEGNPLFIEEIVRSMVDQGILTRRSGDGWKMVQAPRDIIIPDSIQGIFQARIDQLDEEAKRVLQVAACIGRKFSRRILAAVAGDIGVPPRLLDQHLTTLEKAGLIQREDGVLEGAYVFRHVLIRDTVHSGLLRSSRSQLHRAVAQWYEENLQPGSEPPYAVLAYHYEQTDSYEKQRLYFAKAGHEAARGYANREAVLFFAKALALTTDPDQRFVLLLARERACDLLGDRTRQRADLDELLQLATQAGDHRRRAIVYNRLAAWHETQGDYPAARSAANEGLIAARRAGDVQLEAESLLVIAAAHWRQGQFTAALEAGQAALEASRAVQDAGSEAVSLALLGIVHRSLGDLYSARRCYQQALDIRQTIGDRRGEAISLSHLANLFYDQGEYTATFTHHQQALDLFRQVGDRRGEAWSLSGLGTFYLTCGDYEAARSHYEEVLAIRRDIGDRRGEAVALGDLGNLLLAIGELEAARAYLEEAVALTRAIRARRDEVYGLTYLGRVLEKMGNLDGARAAHQVALSRRREQGQEASSIENVAGLGRVAMEQGDLEAAQVYATEALAYVREHGLIQVGSPFLVYHTCIRIFEACGEEEAARQALEEAYEGLVARAERIADPQLRRSYLERVPEHREIVAAWREAKGD